MLSVVKRSEASHKTVLLRAALGFLIKLFACFLCVSVD
jgi:hypothetical protein